MDDSYVERALRWVVNERGAADLSDELGREVIVPRPPSCFSPATTVVAGRVQLYRRERPADGAPRPSSFEVMRNSVAPGAVVLVHCESGIGAGFGSNVVLHAAALRAQAIVTDGAWRDTTRALAVGIPVGSNGADPTRPAGCPMVESQSEDMFGVSWRPGDWFLRDADGVLRLADDAARRLAADLGTSAQGELRALLGT